MELRPLRATLATVINQCCLWPFQPPSLFPILANFTNVNLRTFRMQLNQQLFSAGCSQIVRDVVLLHGGHSSIRGSRALLLWRALRYKDHYENWKETV